MNLSTVWEVVFENGIKTEHWCFFSSTRLLHNNLLLPIMMPRVFFPFIQGMTQVGLWQVSVLYSTLFY